MDYKCPVCKKEFYPLYEHSGCLNKFTTDEFIDALQALWDLYEDTLGELSEANERFD